MSTTVTAADTYITENVIDTEGWAESDAAKRQRLLNAAERTLIRYYSKYTIPDDAVYEFAAALATVYSDVMIAGQRGVQATSLSGVTSTTFREGQRELVNLIPQACRDIVGDANGVTLPARKVGRLVL
ncbi:hypothetical protein [Paenibacillus durus]|uniref:Phage protein n=1 Tax=Paenibacillus durus TaxID=44251 RepID=A0A089HTD4_PAEDU|nr:hypothetical protein [Paenibacillus durus]AIQ13633.1 hypothetical protein PDUR_18205 [Paenibacillus durus]